MKRRALWIALALLLASCGSPDAPRPACDRFLSQQSASADALRHEPQMFDLAPSPRKPRSFYAAAHTLYLDEAVAQFAIDAGFDTIVQVFPWRDLNPEPGVFDWHAADAMVRVGHDFDLNLVVRLDMPPLWATRAVTSGVPFELSAYAHFVEATAARYRGHILGYIIWNEPNLAAEWSRSGGLANNHWESYEGWVADPADYLGVVGVAYQRIKAADPDALVVAGGLAPTNEISERAHDDREFLRAMYANGKPLCFDVLAVHDYGYGLSPYADRSTNDELNLSRVEAVREIMLTHDDTRPVWITEQGYTLQSSVHPAVSEAEQAHYLLGSFERVRAEWPWIEMLTVWNLSVGQPPEGEMAGFSIVNPDGTPRIAFDVLRKYLRTKSP